MQVVLMLSGHVGFDTQALAGSLQGDSGSDMHRDRLHNIPAVAKAWRQS
jgi:hypothetical protein